MDNDQQDGASAPHGSAGQEPVRRAAVLKRWLSGRLVGVLFASFGFVALRFLLTPLRIKILTSLLDKDEYGTLTLVSLTISFLSIVFSLGSLEFMLRKLPGQTVGYQQNTLKSVMVLFGGVFAVLAFGVVLVLQRWPLPKIGLTGGDYILCGLLLFVTVHVMQRVYYMLGQRKYTQARVTQLLYSDSWFLPLLFFFILGSLTMTQVLWVWLVWMVLAIAVSNHWIRFGRVLRARISPRRMTEVLEFGLPLMPMSIGDLLFRIQDRYILAWARDLDAVANYSLCVNIAMVGFLVGAALLDIMTTEFFKMRNEEASGDLEAILRVPHLRQSFTTMTRFAVILSIPVASVLTFMGPQLIRLLSHEKFLDAAAIFPWTAPFPILFLMTYILGRGLMALDRSLALGGMTLLASLVNVALNFLLIPRYGEAGTAVATSIGLFVLALMLGRMMRLRLWIRREDLMPWRLLIYSVGCFLGVGAIAHWEPLGGVVTLILGGCFCGAMLLVLGLLRRVDLDLMTGSFGS